MNITNKSIYRKWRKGQVGDSKYNVKLFVTYGRDSKGLELHKSHIGRTSLSDMESYFTENKFKGVRMMLNNNIK